MKKNILFGSLALLVTAGNAVADICETDPSCEALGYVYTADQCEGQTQIKCPFDQTKVYCTKSLPVPCKVGMRYDTAIGGCTRDNTGDYIVSKVNSTSSCDLVIPNGLTFSGTGTSTRNLRTKCKSVTADATEVNILNAVILHNAGHTSFTIPSSAIALGKKADGSNSVGMVNTEAGKLYKIKKTSSDKTDFGIVCGKENVSCTAESSDVTDMTAIKRKLCVPGTFMETDGYCYTDVYTGGYVYETKFIIDVDSNYNATCIDDASYSSATTKADVALNTAITTCGGVDNVPTKAQLQEWLVDKGAAQSYIDRGNTFMIAKDGCIDLASNIPLASQTCDPVSDYYVFKCLSKTVIE